MGGGKTPSNPITYTFLSNIIHRFHSLLGSETFLYSPLSEEESEGQDTFFPYHSLLKTHSNISSLHKAPKPNRLL